MCLKLNFKNMLYVYFTILIFGSLVTILSLGSTIFSQELWLRDFCFQSDCVGRFIELTQESYVFVYWSGVISSGIFALVSISLLFHSYISNMKSQNIANNISQYKHFMGYVESLVGRYDQISTESISALDWYRNLYRSPADGDFRISKKYIKKVKDLDELVCRSNAEFVAGGDYRFRAHQHELIQLVGRLGMEIHPGPRTEFFESERQLVSLINDVHIMFVPPEYDLRPISEAKYK